MEKSDKLCGELVEGFGLRGLTDGRSTISAMTPCDIDDTCDTGCDAPDEETRAAMRRDACRKLDDLDALERRIAQLERAMPTLQADLRRHN